MGGDTVVFYEEEDLEEFEPPASWSHAVLDTEDMGKCLSVSLSLSLSLSLPASRAEDPGFESRWSRDFFAVKSYQ